MHPFNSEDKFNMHLLQTFIILHGLFSDMQKGIITPVWT